MIPPESLQEAALTAWRPQDPVGAIRPHPAWADLDHAGRLALYEATIRARVLEAALNLNGLTPTGRAVMARILRRAGT